MRPLCLLDPASVLLLLFPGTAGHLFRLTTSSPQVLPGAVTVFTCSAPFKTNPSFQWLFDNTFVSRYQQGPNGSIRAGLKQTERVLDSEVLVYSQLEIYGHHRQSGTVRCLVWSGNSVVMLSSPYVVTGDISQLHLPLNSSCDRETLCVDGNSTCYIDLRTQVPRCGCRRGYGYYSSPRAQCKVYYGDIGSPCYADTECVEHDPHSYCLYGRCSCQRGYSSAFKINRCVRVVNLSMPCDSETICLVPHSFCSNRTCRCFPGHAYDGNRCALIVEVSGGGLRLLIFVIFMATSVVSVVCIVSMLLFNLRLFQSVSMPPTPARNARRSSIRN